MSQMGSNEHQIARNRYGLRKPQNTMTEYSIQRSVLARVQRVLALSAVCSALTFGAHAQESKIAVDRSTVGCA